MKKQILAFMACAAFLAPAPCLCMEKDEDTPRNRLSTLPKEIHQVILENLIEAKDTVSMKRVANYFYSLVRETKNIIPLEIFCSAVFTHSGRCTQDGYFTEGESKFINKGSAFDLLLEEANEKAPIFLGHFEISSKASEIQGILVLPKYVKEGVFQAQWLDLPTCIFRSSNSDTKEAYLSKISNDSKIRLEITDRIFKMDMSFFYPRAPSHFFHNIFGTIYTIYSNESQTLLIL